MALTMAEIEPPLVNSEEQIILNQVRRHRNLMLHRAGEPINITKAFANDFLQTVENILIRAGNLNVQIRTANKAKIEA